MLRRLTSLLLLRQAYPSTCYGAITGCEIMSKLKCGIKDKSFATDGKAAGTEARTPNCQRPLFSETYFLQPVSDITPVQEDDCSYAAIPHLLESKQRYYSLPVMKLNVEIAVVLTEDMHCNNKGCPNGQPLKAESFTFCCR